MNEVNKLREEVRKARRNASNKIARTLRQTGAKIAGSNVDPRREAGVIDRYNKPQLQAYLGQLKEFNSRNVQFVAGKQGTPLPRHRANELIRVANAAHNAHENHLQGMANVQVAPLGLTVQQFRDIRPNAVRSGLRSTPYGSTPISYAGVQSPEALEKLIQDQRRKLSSNFIPKKIDQGRHNLEKALEIMGNDDLLQAVSVLDDYQFDVLWHGTSFAETAFMKYDLEKSRASESRKERWQDKGIDDAYEHISEFLEWASTVSEGDNGGTKKTKGNGRNRR